MPPEEPVPQLATSLWRCFGWSVGEPPDEAVARVFARALAFVLWRDQGVVEAVCPGADATFQGQVFPFFSSNTAATLRHRFGTVESLCTEGAHELAAALLGRDRDDALAAAIVSAWDAFEGRLGRPAISTSVPMDQTLISALLLGTGIVAAFAAFWQTLGASEEFCELARLQGGTSWGRKLLRQGPMLAERTRWTLRAAWDEARRRNELSHEETASAIHALGGAPPGRRISCVAGESFDRRTMKASSGSTEPRFVAAVLRDGLDWKGQVLARAEVDAGTADYVAVMRSADGSDREKLLAAAGSDPAGLRLTKAVFHDALDRLRDPAERDGWLRRLAEHWPGSEIRLIVPRAGEDFDDWTMTSTDKLSAPRLAQVTELQHCGLRRTDSGEVLVRALVTTCLRPEATRRI